MSSGVAAGSSERFQQILGIRFFDGTPAGAVAYLKRVGGYVVVPAAPALVKLRYDEAFRAALVQSDLAIADSGLMVLLWKLFERRRISRISGLAYLKRLLELREIHEAGKAFWILPAASAAESAKKWLRDAGFGVSDEDFYIAPFYGAEVSDEVLAAAINARRPTDVIIAIGGGPQEKLGLFLRDHLGYRPAIHCIGAALGFLTGDQIAIPDWADRLYLGWLFRLFAQPRVFIPRLWSAHELPWLIFKYREKLPPLKN
ncbi:MAG: N-acetylglucosaminyldiphosphoundecaprenol N-acetyl-beta-D-mannosaminyltransferase [Verrucomicrobiota bacterium]